MRDRWRSEPLRATIEIFQRTRRIESVPAGHTLRVMDSEPFHLVWTADDWATKNETEAKTVAPLASFADVATELTQTGSLRFTPVLAGAERVAGAGLCGRGDGSEDEFFRGSNAFGSRKAIELAAEKARSEDRQQEGRRARKGQASKAGSGEREATYGHAALSLVRAGGYTNRRDEAPAFEWSAAHNFEMRT